MSQEPEILQTLRLNADLARPTSSTSQLTLSQLQKIADDFDLGRVISMDQPLTTQCNITDPFKTGRGTFMVRIRHDEEFGERVEFLHEAINFLNSRGYPAPEVMRTRSGSTFSLWGDRIVEIHRFIKHDEGTHRDWQRMLSAATALGDLHAHMNEFRPSTSPVPPEMRNDLQPAECWSMLPFAERSIESQIGVHPQAEAVRRTLDMARDLLPRIMDNYERISGGLPWMFVHGDYHFWNVLYRGDEVIGVVDYDFLQERDRLFDVAYALQGVVNYLNYVENRPSEEYGLLNWNNVRLWVDQYDDATHMPLTTQERERLPMEILRVYLVNLIVCANQPDPVNSVLGSGSEIQLYQWISKQNNLFKQ